MISEGWRTVERRTSERQTGERLRYAALVVVVLVHEQALGMEMADPSNELALAA